MRFQSAKATLEPQKYVTDRTVWTENILLVSGRLVLLQNCFLEMLNCLKQNCPNCSKFQNKTLASFQRLVSCFYCFGHKTHNSKWGIFRFKSEVDPPLRIVVNIEIKYV